MKKWSLLLFAVLLISPLITLSQASYVSQPQRKIALVIGNGSYISSELANPENDAKAIKGALQNVGFTVIEYENLTQSQMKKAIDDFGDKLKSYDVGLFFYAGHGIQAKGYNYLIPVDAELKSEQQVEYDCVQADRILALMEASGSKVNIIILDACRNNPFERSWTRAATGKGLAFMNAPSGTLIAYATSPGSTSSDGSGKNGLYTSAILESIQLPNLSIIQMFQNVRAIVSEKSNKQQIPWESTSLTGDFYFTSRGIDNSGVQENIKVAQLYDNSRSNSNRTRKLGIPVKPNSILILATTYPYGLRYQYRKSFGAYASYVAEFTEYTKNFTFGLVKSIGTKVDIFLGGGPSSVGNGTQGLPLQKGTTIEGGSVLHFGTIAFEVGFGHDTVQGSIGILGLGINF